MTPAEAAAPTTPTNETEGSDDVGSSNQNGEDAKKQASTKQAWRDR